MVLPDPALAAHHDDAPRSLDRRAETVLQRLAVELGRAPAGVDDPARAAVDHLAPPLLGHRGAGRQHPIVGEVGRGQRHRLRGREVGAGLGFHVQTHFVLLVRAPRPGRSPQPAGRRCDESPEQYRHPEERQQDQADRQHGQRHHGHVAPLLGEGEHVLLEADPLGGVRDELRQLPDRPQEQQGQRRHHHDDPPHDQPPRRRPELGDARVGGEPGPEAAEHRADPREEVRYPGEVGEHVVAVEPHRGDQLLQHLHLQDQQAEQEDAVPGPEVRRRQRDHAPGVEVQAAEVRADAPAPGQAVGVGDVGVERREDDVEPDADRAGLRPAVPAGGGVADLVDDRAQGQQRVHDQGQGGPHEQLGHGQPEVGALPHDQVERDHPGEPDDHHRCPVDRHQHPGDRPGHRGRQQRALDGEGEQRVRLRRRGAEVVVVLGAGQQAERLEHLGGEVVETLARQRPAVRRTDGGRDLVGGAVRVEAGEDEVQQLRDLEHLAVPATYQEHRVAQPGALDRPEELEAGSGAPRWGRGGGRVRG